MDDLAQFAWQRATGRGYVWQTLTARETMASKPSRRVRVLTFPTPTGSTISEPIEPHRISGALLWQLASTEPEESAIQEFANAFGLLTDGWLAHAPGKGQRPVFIGEPLRLWQKEIARARFVLSLLDAAESTNTRALAKHISWAKDGRSVSYSWSHDFGKKGDEIASPTNRPETLALFEPGDLVMPARIVVARMLNEQLRAYVRPQLLWSSAEDKFGLFLQPSCLLGAIWLQFAQIQDERKAIGRCEVCGTWFERIRSDKRHCSDRCRVRAMRMRKEKKS